MPLKTKDFDGPYIINSTAGCPYFVEVVGNRTPYIVDLNRKTITYIQFYAKNVSYNCIINITFISKWKCTGLISDNFCEGQLIYRVTGIPSGKWNYNFTIFPNYMHFTSLDPIFKSKFIFRKKV
jgi:hypothetical protein